MRQRALDHRGKNPKVEKALDGENGVHPSLTQVPPSAFARRSRRACLRSPTARPTANPPGLADDDCVEARRVHGRTQLAALTVEVMDATTPVAILNCASRSVMPWRRAIQPK